MKKLLILLICSGCTLTISIQPVKKNKEVSSYGFGLTKPIPGILNGNFPNGTLELRYDHPSTLDSMIKPDSTWNFLSIDSLTKP